MARFVLVHGSFGGGWCWEAVLPLLGELGHEVDAPDLPGSGDDRTPVGEVTLDAYVARVRSVLAESDEPAILVGHDMGGMVITQAAARGPELVERLVYLAAFLPRDGQSLLDLTRLQEAADDEVHAHLTIEGEPAVGALTAKVMARGLFNCATNSQLDWAIERTRPQPLAPLLAPVQLGSWTLEADRRVYVHCTQDRVITPPLEALMIEETPCGEIRELDSDHSPFLSRPRQLARLLDMLAVVSDPAP
jgi:pimeloyl-ACP methyl ester carboxylesterase